MSEKQRMHCTNHADSRNNLFQNLCNKSLHADWQPADPTPSHAPEIQPLPTGGGREPHRSSATGGQEVVYALGEQRLGPLAPILVDPFQAIAAYAIAKQITIAENATLPKN